VPTPVHPNELSALSALALIGQLGLVVAVPIAAGAVAGAWLDARLDTRGLCTIGLIVLGLAGGIAGAWRIIKREIERGSTTGA
jgi:predicted F0F1-ATPase subunit